METETPEKKKIHEGRNAKRWREVMGVTQIDLADFLGVSQQTVSRIEDKKEIEPETLNKIAEKIGVKPEIIKTKEPATALASVINNVTISDSPQSHGGNTYPIHYDYNQYYNCTFGNAHTEAPEVGKE